MQIAVKKFGGTSLANVDSIHHVANIIHQAHEKRQACVVVVSAMAGTTNQLEHWTKQIGPSLGPNADRDMVLSSGEMITAGLLSMALQQRGVKSRAWMGWQIPLVTTEIWGRSDAVFTGTQNLMSDISEGIIPVVCGFQGVTPTGRITTLGRGGSDTTAVIIAAALKAHVCEIFTDVQGVYSADPAYVKSAFPYPELSYDTMLTLSEHGAKVLHAKSIHWAKKHQIPIHVLSTMKPELSGTWIKSQAPDACGIVYKPVLSWKMDFLPQEAEAQERRAITPFIDWIVSSKGLHFLTWSEDYHHVRAQWPDAVCSDPKMLVSIIGSSPAVSHALTQHTSIPIEHCVRQSGMFGVMIEQKHAYDMVRYAHQYLEPYGKPA